MLKEISLLDVLRQRHEVSELGDFSTLDTDLQTADGARYWLDCKLGMLSGSAGQAAEYFEQIPHHLRSMAVCDVLVRRNPEHLGLISHLLEGYPSLVMTALRKEPSTRILGLVHPQYRTEGMIKNLLQDRQSSALAKAILKTDWIMEQMTPGLVEFACAQSFEFALNADRALLADSALAALATYHINGYNKIRDAGRFDLLVTPISQGFWPRSNLVTGDLKKPAGLSNGFRMLISARSEDEEALYMAYMMTHPVANVVKVLRGPKGIRFLMEMYAPDQLRPHLKEASNLVRGKILESDLGM